jgi:3-dehydroquinate synthase
VLQSRERLLARDTAALAAVIRRSVEIKAAVVQDDEREHGKRAVLNFGHTVGHAVEAAMGYQLLHGEAVALGMVLEAQIGNAAGITDALAVRAVTEAVRAFNLPLELPAGVSPTALYQAMAGDKKSRAGVVRFALLERLGAVARSGQAWTHTVADAVVGRVLGVPPS